MVEIVSLFDLLSGTLLKLVGRLDRNIVLIDCIRGIRVRRNWDCICGDQVGYHCYMMYMIQAQFRSRCFSADESQTIVDLRADSDLY